MGITLATWEKLVKALDKGETNEIKEFLKFLSPVELAEIMEELSLPKLHRLLPFLTEKEIAGAFEFMNPDTQGLMAFHFDNHKLAQVINQMSPDEAADFLTLLDEGRVQEIFNYLDQETSNDLQKLMTHSPDTAGGLMTSDFIAFQADKTVGETLEEIQFLELEDSEILSYIYVVDQREKLIGVVSLREIFKASNETLIKDIMHDKVISVELDTDQEEVAAILERHGFLTIPVIDEENILQGIVTLDDMLEVIERETTEDIYKQSGLSVTDTEFLRSEKILKAPVLTILKLRIPWLVIVLVGGILAGGVIGQFEEILQSVVVLAFFIPVIMDMGGNVGTQSSTIVVRGVVLGQIDTRNIWTFLGKETLIGFTIGVLAGAAAALVAFLWQREPLVSLVVFLSMTLTCTLASTIGYLIPMLSHRFGYDPAASSNPLITTIKDISGLLIYFSLASFLLRQFL